MSLTVTVPLPLLVTVNVAVPDVMGAFGIGQDKAQWMSSAYMATMTAGMLLSAWVVSVLGERRVFVAEKPSRRPKYACSTLRSRRALRRQNTRRADREGF